MSEVECTRFGAGVCVAIKTPRSLGYEPKQSRRRAFDYDYDPYSNVVLINNGDILFRGKAAIRVFEFRRSLKKDGDL